MTIPAIAPWDMVLEEPGDAATVAGRGAFEEVGDAMWAQKKCYYRRQRDLTTERVGGKIPTYEGTRRAG